MSDPAAVDRCVVDSRDSKGGGAWILTLVPMQRSMGVAWYDEEALAVRCASVAWSPPAASKSDSAEAPTIATSWLTELLAGVQPTADITVYVPPQPAWIILDVLDELVVRRGGAVRTMPTVEHHSARRLIEQLTQLWPDAARNYSDAATYWSCRLRLWRVPEMVAALSGTLAAIVRGSLPVADVTEEPPQSLVGVDDATLAALGVFREDVHPCAYQGIGGNKEGFSVFSLFQSHVRTPVGRELLRFWLRCPINNVDELSRRWDVTQFFADPSRQTLSKQLSKVLSHAMVHPGSVVARMRAGKHRTADYGALLKCALVVRDLAELLQPHTTAASSIASGGMKAVQEVLHRFVSRVDIRALTEIIELIRSAIDLTPNRSGHTAGVRGARVTLLGGVDGQLDELRARYNNLGPYLTRFTEELALSLPEAYWGWKLSCIFYPGVGYLVAVKVPPLADDELSPWTSHPSEQRLLLPHGWTEVLRTTEALFCRTAETSVLDEELGDMHAAIIQREESVRVTLDEQVIALAPSVMALLHVGEIDCLQAFAAVAAEQGWVRPNVFPPPADTASAAMQPLHVELSGALHPLLATTAALVVPFDFSVSAAEGRVTVITGPNGSGKSVLMHATVLIVFLAHVGSFVPCASARMSTTDRIALVSDDTVHKVPAKTAKSTSSAQTNGGGDEQQLLAACGGSSSFASELLAVSRALEQATPRSLIALDEFGRGTLPADGVAILGSMLLSLIKPPQNVEVVSSPVLLLATHYAELLCPAVGIMDSPLAQHLQMQVVVSNERREENRRTEQPDDDDAGANYLMSSACDDVPSIQCTFQVYRTCGSNREYPCATARPVARSCAVQCARICGAPPFLIGRVIQLQKQDNVKSFGDDTDDSPPTVFECDSQSRHRRCEDDVDELISVMYSCKMTFDSLASAVAAWGKKHIP